MLRDRSLRVACRMSPHYFALLYGDGIERPKKYYCLPRLYCTTEALPCGCYGIVYTFLHLVNV